MTQGNGVSNGKERNLLESGKSADDGYYSTKVLEALYKYKYGAVDKSLLTKYVLSPYANWIVQFFPMWMAPNLITFLALCFMFVNLFLVWYYIPDFSVLAPKWVYFVFAIGLHVYQTLDNVDGKQARRTGTSSPLGELFDHGCDALNATVGAIVQVAAMGLGFGWRATSVVLLTTFPFMVQTWEEYHTGVLYLGYLNGPAEGITGGYLLLLANAIVGHSIWYTEVSQLVGFDVEIPAWIREVFGVDKLLLCDILAINLFGLLIFVQIPQSCFNVYRAVSAKKQPFLPTILEMIPFSAFNICCWLWLVAPSSVILKEHLLLFMITFGIIFGRIASKLIIHYLLQKPFPYFSWNMFPMVLPAIDSLLQIFLHRSSFLFPTPQYEVLYLQAYLCFSAVLYLYWAFYTVHSFASFLNVGVFRILNKQHQQ